MVSKYNKIFNVAMKAVYKAGAFVASKNDGKQKYEVKSSRTDLLTAADKEVESMLINDLSARYPAFKVISEEMEPLGLNEALTNEPTWLIDPIDGTMNFIHSYPQSCISLALFVNKVPVIGIIYNSVLDQKFTAIQGQGAFNNDCRMRVSRTKKLNKALILMELGTAHKKKGKYCIENFNRLTNRVHGIRATGSCALNLAMVASGGGDAVFEMGIHHWDFGAGMLIVEEAGGVVINPNGEPFDLFSRRILCASTIDLACELSDCLAQYYSDARDK